MMDVSGGTEAGDESNRPHDCADVRAAAVNCVYIDIMCSEVG